MDATTTATDSETTSSTVSLATRYSRKRSGVEMMAPSVRSCFSKNNVPGMKKSPKEGGPPEKAVGPGAPPQTRRHGQQHRQPDQAGEDSRVQKPLPDLKNKL